MEYRIRKGVKADVPFLEKMLREAALWSGNTGIDTYEIMSKPEISVILMDWGNSGDTALIAETKEARPIGAAWYRYYSKEKHSYGFVDEETPEIGIAVEQRYRGKGIGSSLLKGLLDEAIQQNVGKLSLSVDRDNFAVGIYEKARFVNIDDVGDQHWTMVLHLR